MIDMLKNRKSLIFALLLFVGFIGLACVAYSTQDRVQTNVACLVPGIHLFCTKTPDPDAQTSFIDNEDQEALAQTGEPHSPPEEAIQTNIPTASPTTQYTPTITITAQSTVAPAETMASTLPPPDAEGVYYVSPEGNNGYPGTMDQPWKTLRFAASQLRAGDTLFIRGGTYQEVTKWQASGSPDAPITIQNYPDEQVIIDGYDTIPYNTGGTWMFLVEGDWYIIRGLEVTRSFDEGAIGVRGDHVIIENCFVHHNWAAGITMMGDDGLAQYNRVWYNGIGNEFLSRTRGGWPAALTCARYPTNCTLRGNISWENWGEGISTFEAYNTTIEDNISYNNQQNVYVSDTQNTIVQRNFIYCTPDNIIGPYVTQTGILVGDEKYNPASSDNMIINNIVYGCDRNLAIGTNESTNNLVAHNTFVNGSGDANVYFYEGNCAGCRFLNNLIVQEDDLAIAINQGDGWYFDHNLWSKKPPGHVSGEKDLITDPLLSKEGTPFSPAWHRLTGSSPAINQAQLMEFVLVDYYKINRKTAPDIGAHEY